MVDEENNAVVEPVVEPVVAPVVESVDLIATATSAAARLEAANLATEALIIRQEKLAVDKMLGGVASVSVEKQDESPEDYAKRILDGE